MKKILYLGLEPSAFYDKKNILHYPVIRIEPRKGVLDRIFFEEISQFPYVLLTSRSTVFCLFAGAKKLAFPLQEVLKSRCLSIGPSTSEALIREGVHPLLEAVSCTQEGMLALLADKEGPFLYPRSSRARPLLATRLQGRVKVIDLYDTLLQHPFPLPRWEEVEEIVFTSPSTVEGFFQIHPFPIPSVIKISCQGVVTEKALRPYLQKENEVFLLRDV